MKKYNLISFAARYWVYYLALALGFFWFRQQTARQARLAEAVAATVQLVSPAVNEQNRKLLANIDESTTAYSNEHNEKYGNRALIVRRLWEHFQTRSLSLNGKPGDAELLASFQQQAGNFPLFADSLLNLCDCDPQIKSELSTIKVLVEKLHKSLPSERFLGSTHAPLAQWTDALELQAGLAAYTVLHYLDLATSGSQCFIDPCEPFLAPRQLWPRAAQPFEADIFLGCYLPASIPFDIFVNDKNYTLRDGRVRYQGETVQDAGENRLNVRIVTRDSADRVRQVTESLFELNP